MSVNQQFWGMGVKTYRSHGNRLFEGYPPNCSFDNFGFFSEFFSEPDRNQRP